MKKIIALGIFASFVLFSNAEVVDETPVEETTPATLPEKSPLSVKSLLEAAQPTAKFGGYIIGKYSITDRDGQASNGGFDLRLVRLYVDGNVFKDFYYKLQLQVNGAPGEDKGPRIVDAFV